MLLFAPALTCTVSLVAVEVIRDEDFVIIVFEVVVVVTVCLLVSLITCRRWTAATWLPTFAYWLDSVWSGNNSLLQFDLGDDSDDVVDDDDDEDDEGDDEDDDEHCDDNECRWILCLATAAQVSPVTPVVVVVAAAPTDAGLPVVAGTDKFILLLTGTCSDVGVTVVVGAPPLRSKPNDCIGLTVLIIVIVSVCPADQFCIF